MGCSCCRLCLRSCAGITALNLSCVGTQTTLVFFISHVAAITSAAHVNGIVGSKQQQLDPLNAPLLTTLLTFPSGFTRLPTTFIFQAEQVLLINRSTERPAGPLPSLHLLSSALINIHVTSVVENYHSFQRHLFYIRLHSLPTHKLRFSVFHLLLLPVSSTHPVAITASPALWGAVHALIHAVRYPSCLGAKLGSELSHVASLLEDSTNWANNLEFLLCLSDNKALGEGGL